MHRNETKCLFCLEIMGPHTSITPECCKLAWIHRICLKKFALESGYNLTCPFCCNKEFREYIRKWGIFVPDKSVYI